jgi:hypothetical protein
MSADRAPCNDRLVVHVSASRAAEVRERAEALGTLEALEGHEDLFVLRLREPQSEARGAWNTVQHALGVGCEVEPVLVDAQGEAHYPTGRIEVRFREAPSDPDLERFAAEHGLRVRGRNRYVSVQAEFQIAEPGRFLPDLIDGIERSAAVRAVWPDTLSRYRRG